MIRRRQILLIGLLLASLAFAALAWCYWSAVQAPVVRHATLGLKNWPAGAPRLRAILISDIHVAGPDMPPDRLGRIVDQINALSPDLVLIAGDLVSEKRAATRYYSMADAIRPLAKLRAPLGSFAVLGNHDHWYDPAGAKKALAAAGIRLLENDAAQAGPLAVGGLDDDFTGRDDLPRTLARQSGLNGARILLSHSPDPFPDVPDTIGLMLAGHTHCGQIAPPLVGPISTMSRHGKRYACGLVRERGKVLVVTAGLGTSGLPLRLGAIPDMWLLDLGPE
ncbi:MAG: metallophosphoesterase [Pseudomonadota bacterium]|nr:metallophosphoesterase [Pseudomonadota bacterium]